MHDLIIVAVLDADLPQRRPRDDLQIPFDRYPKGIKTEQIHHLGHGRSAGNAPMFAVHSDAEGSVETH